MQVQRGEMPPLPPVNDFANPLASFALPAIQKADDLLMGSCDVWIEVSVT